MGAAERALAGAASSQLRESIAAHRYPPYTRAGTRKFWQLHNNSRRRGARPRPATCARARPAPPGPARQSKSPTPTVSFVPPPRARPGSAHGPGALLVNYRYSREQGLLVEREASPSLPQYCSTSVATSIISLPGRRCVFIAAIRAGSPGESGPFALPTTAFKAAQAAGRSGGTVPHCRRCRCNTGRPAGQRDVCRVRGSRGLVEVPV